MYKRQTKCVRSLQSYTFDCPHTKYQFQQLQLSFVGAVSFDYVVEDEYNLISPFCQLGQQQSRQHQKAHLSRNLPFEILREIFILAKREWTRPRYMYRASQRVLSAMETRRKIPICSTSTRNLRCTNPSKASVGSGMTLLRLCYSRLSYCFQISTVGGAFV